MAVTSPVRLRCLVVLVVPCADDSVSLERRLVQVAAKETHGGVLSCAVLRGKVVAGINSKVQVFRWDTSATMPHSADVDAGQSELNGACVCGASTSECVHLPSCPPLPYPLGKQASRPLQSIVHMSGWRAAECGRQCNILALHVATRGDLVLVGDLMMSMTLMRYFPVDGKIEEVAGTAVTWTVAIERPLSFRHCDHLSLSEGQRAGCRSSRCVTVRAFARCSGAKREPHGRRVADDRRCVSRRRR
jgi:hypothetical protein